ncbi:hypothetical protein M0R04_16270 [Candidatus Dojkabacteria bacterium]|nr:hypothetical protein [Candidatus Dojkabacteria bacterium]
MKQADVFMDFVYDSRFCFLTLYNYTVAFDREAEDCDREHTSWKLCFFTRKLQSLEVQ